MIKKKIFLLFILITIIGCAVFYKGNYLKHKLLTSLPSHYQVVLQVIHKPERVKHFKNDYNVNFLPKTQFIDLNYIEKKLDFKPFENIRSSYSNEEKNISFKIGLYKDLIYTIDNKANVKRFMLTLNKGSIELIDYKNVPTNIEDTALVIDFLIHDEIIYISYLLDTKNCKYLKIAKSKINIMPLDFKAIYNPDFCFDNLEAASIQFYEHDDVKGLLISISSSQLTGQDDAQDLKSIQGKILFLNLKNNKSNVFSYGHRSPQGLLVLNDVIISTEHGPKGGDEINKIEFNGNYGWPLSSYGEPYYEKAFKPLLDKNHEKNNFIEPIYSFVPSIGISDIIKLPNLFSPYWENNFILASLNNKSLFRLKFDDKYSKIIYYERIFIGKRIRDVKYYRNINAILLAQEYDGTLGILFNK